MTKKKPKSAHWRIYSLDISNENLFQLNSNKSFEIDQAEKTEYGKKYLNSLNIRLESHSSLSSLIKSFLIFF